jgi:hypothetical protein
MRLKAVVYGGAALAIVVATGQGSAYAQARPNAVGRAANEGVVVAVEPSIVYIDMGAQRGVTVGTEFVVWRDIQRVHPVSRDILRDRFRLGTLHITQVGQHLAIGRFAPAEESAAPEHRLVPGDIVVRPLIGFAPSAPPKQVAVASEGDTPAAALPASPTAAAAPAEVAPAVGARAAPHAASESQNDWSPSAAASEPAPQITLAAARFQTHPQIARGDRLRLTFELDARIETAVFHYRTRVVDGSEPSAGYRSARLVRQAHTGQFWSVEFARVEAPLEYFVEQSIGTATFTAIGSAAAPERVDLALGHTAASSSERDNRYFAALHTEFASFSSRRLNDYVWQTGTDFGVRFANSRLDGSGLRALRSGFGVFRGRGGSLAELDVQDLDGRNVGLTYGHIEAEYAFHDTLSTIGRLVLGLGKDGVTAGVQGLLRIGNDRRTNLLLGGELLGGVGARGIVQLEWNAIARVPIVFRTEVTNQPAGASAGSILSAADEARGSTDIGARAIVQAGYRFPVGITPSLRVSYQGRTINHAGPGFGANVSYEW